MKQKVVVAVLALLVLSAPAFAGQSLTGIVLGGMADQKNKEDALGVTGGQEDALRKLQQQQEWDRIQQQMQRQNDETMRQMSQPPLVPPLRPPGHR